MAFVGQGMRETGVWGSRAQCPIKCPEIWDSEGLFVPEANPHLDGPSVLWLLGYRWKNCTFPLFPRNSFWEDLDLVWDSKCSPQPEVEGQTFLLLTSLMLPTRQVLVWERGLWHFAWALRRLATWHVYVCQVSECRTPKDRGLEFGDAKSGKTLGSRKVFLLCLSWDD